MGKAMLEIPVLFGSQTGNAEAAAIELSSMLSKELSSSTLRITSRALHLDDFLENGAKWSPLFVVITSSYGVGQAPIGCHKFREFCDHLLTKSDQDYGTLLDGCQYAMLGLGDSKFTTFFLNPTAIDSSLSKVGAIRLGKLGKADASGSGDYVQSKVIDDWCNTILMDLKFALKDKNTMLGEFLGMSGEDAKEKSRGKLTLMQNKTLQICSDIFEDWDEIQQNNNKDAGKRAFSISMLVLPILIAILVSFFLSK